VDRDPGLEVGRRVRLRVLARDVSLTRTPQTGTSIGNQLHGTIEAIADDEHPALALVRVRIVGSCGGAGGGAPDAAFGARAGTGRRHAGVGAGQDRGPDGVICVKRQPDQRRAQAGRAAGCALLRAAAGAAGHRLDQQGRAHRRPVLQGCLAAAGNGLQPGQRTLLETATGGAGGGGTRLTPAALGLLDAWHTLQTEQREFLRAQEARLSQLPALSGLLRRMSMKTTARNQFAGTVKAVDAGPVSAR
jgi:hypothetical protein